jgi:hypothetical protein
MEAFRRLVTHPRLRQVPLILETPKSSELDDRRNLRTVRRLANIAPAAPNRLTTRAASAAR